MSDKASGNETEGRRDDERDLEQLGTPEGEELSIDCEAGDQLDITDRWWDNSDSDEREGKGNRKVTPNERAAAEAEKAEAAEEAEEVVGNERETDEDSEEGAKDTEEEVGKPEGPVDVGALIKKSEPVDGLEEILGERGTGRG